MVANTRLPPLKSLVVFEAAARLQSFTLAAGELSVTQGAVSRQIRHLEEHLGRALFRRERRGVQLNDDGHTYLLSVSHALEQLRGATSDLLSRADGNQVTVVTTSALATFFLVPRVPAFRQRFTDIPIRLMARESPRDARPGAWDLSLYYYRQPPADDSARLLFGESVFPVCSPDYLARHRERLGSNPVEALAHDLVWQESGEDWVNWPEWLEAMNIHVERFDNRLLVDHHGMVVQAAIAGDGIALGWGGLVDAELESGRLVRPLDLVLETDGGFYLATAPGRSGAHQVIAFRDWLLAESG